jgi:type I restriction enzyme R subunit
LVRGSDSTRGDGGAIEIIKGKARKRARGRVDYTMRIKVNLASQPVAVALIEAKAEGICHLLTDLSKQRLMPTVKGSMCPSFFPVMGIFSLSMTALLI